MCKGGFIKISRDITSWQWYDVPDMLSLWIHLLIDANYEDRIYHGKIVKRGSFVTTIPKLAEEVGISVQKVRTCLNRMKLTNEINIQTTNKYSIITVCKYDSYQLNQNSVQHENNIQTTDKQQTNNTLKNKEVKKEESKENINNKLLIQKKESFEYDLSMVDKQFLDSVKLWLEHKKGLGKRFKTQKSFEIAYHKWMKDFNNDPGLFSASVEYSIAGNFEGIYKDKNYGNGKDCRPIEKDERRDELRREIEADIIRISGNRKI